MGVHIHEDVESPEVEAAVRRTDKGRVQPNRVLALELAIVRRTIHTLAAVEPDGAHVIQVVQGQAVSQHQVLIGHPQPPRRVMAACEGVVEQILEKAAGVVVRTDDALARGDTLRAGAVTIGVVDQIVEDGSRSPILYLAEPTGESLRVSRALPTARQQLCARGGESWVDEQRYAAPYDRITGEPLDGAPIRLDQIEWLVARGGNAIASDFAAYKTADENGRRAVRDGFEASEPITDGHSALGPPPPPPPPPAPSAIPSGLAALAAEVAAKLAGPPLDHDDDDDDDDDNDDDDDDDEGT